MTDYHSYILRAWQEPQADEMIWRFSLEIPGAQQRYGFNKLPDLCSFLGQLVESDPQQKEERKS